MERQLPYHPTSFIGRDDEVAAVKALLANPDCRLLTLVGPGGIGKTRLAIQAATELADHYADGVCFVDLQPVQSTALLPSTIADALNIPLNGSAEPQAQLLRYLQEKHILFILDNFEQLLNEEPELLSHILRHTNRVRLLVTSRAALNLQEEWLWSVPGLEYPDRADVESLAAYSAVRLFAERAWRVRKDFSLADEAEDVVQICRLVEGLPLALELAASWTKTLSCAAIAAEIQRNLDFLTTQLRNVPERQRSMQAIFEHTWQMLTADERETFKQLAVFRGGFRYNAARQVAGATLSGLSALVDKSLLRWDTYGRYQVHELLRQYAQERLEASPEAAAQARRRHCAFYTNFLRQRTEDITGARQRDTIQEIAAELDNVRAAWDYAVEHASVADIQNAAYTFNLFCDAQSRYQESNAAFEKAVRRLQQIPPDRQRDFVLAQLYSIMGWQYIRLGQFDNARTTFTQSQALFRELDVPPPPHFSTDPVNGLALVAATVGDYAQALQLAEEGRRQNERHGDRQNLQVAYYVSAGAALSLGQFDTAWEYARQAHALTQETGNHWMMAYVLIIMGHVARARGNYDQARHHYQASYDIKQSFNDPEGIAVAMNHLARLAWLAADYEEAAEQFRQSHAIYQQIGDWGGLATSLHGLGDTALAQGDLPTAGCYYQQALDISTTISWTPLTLLILTSLAELLHQANQPEHSAELLALVLEHPATDLETRRRAQHLLSLLEAALPAIQLGAALAQGRSARLETITTTVQAKLSMLTMRRENGEMRNGRLAPFPEQPLVDPLTARELEVLQLIADGFTNKEIADKLVISPGTVKWYTGQIYSKLQVSHRTQAVAQARELSLL